MAWEHNELINDVFVCSIHPRDKTTIGHRLSYGGLAVAYGRQQKFQGPFPTSFNLMESNFTLGIQFDNGRTPLQLRNKDGFEVILSI